MKSSTAKSEHWIRSLKLEPHPEGGWYRETYRSSGSYDFSGTAPFEGARAYATSIHYLLERGDRSRLHRIHSDELWYFHAGGPLEVHIYPEAGAPSSFILGTAADEGEVLHSWVPAGCWFGAFMPERDGRDNYALVSCVVAPGFDFRDFSFADGAEMAARFPAQREIISRLS